MKFFKEIKGPLSEVSLGDYRTKAGAQKAQSQMGAMFGKPEEREQNLATFKKREAGLNRLKARDEASRKAAQEQQLAELVSRLPELKAEYKSMQTKYKSLGGSNWQYADREQNLTDSERAARAMEGPMNNLWRTINAAEKAQSLAKDSLSEFAPPGSSDGGNDGFSEDTLKRLAAQWWNSDEDPRVEQTLEAAGWEIGQDEGYDNGGAFVVQAGDINGNSYISWPAEELEGLSEGNLEEIDRRGFLQGLGAAALGAAGISASSNAQARGKPEFMAQLGKARELLSKGLTPDQVAKQMGITGPNHGKSGPMIGDGWAAINYAAQQSKSNRQQAADIQEQGVAEGSLNEFAPGGSEGAGPYAYGIALKEMAELYAKGEFDLDDVIGMDTTSQNQSDAEEINSVADAFMNRGMEAGREAYSMVDTMVQEDMDEYLHSQGFNVDADIHAEYQKDVDSYNNSPAGQTDKDRQAQQDAEWEADLPARRAAQVEIAAVDPKNQSRVLHSVQFDAREYNSSVGQLKSTLEQQLNKIKQSTPGAVIRITLGGKPTDIQGILAQFKQLSKKSDRNSDVTEDAPSDMIGGWTRAEREAYFRRRKQNLLQDYALLGKVTTEVIRAINNEVFLTKEQLIDFYKQQITDPDLTALEYAHDNNIPSSGLLKGVLRYLLGRGFSMFDIRKLMGKAAEQKKKEVAEGVGKDRQWSNKDMEKLRVATRDFDDILSADGPEAIKQELIKKRIKTKPMAGPKGQLPEQAVAEDNVSPDVNHRSDIDRTADIEVLGVDHTAGTFKITYNKKPYTVKTSLFSQEDFDHWQISDYEVEVIDSNGQNLIDMIDWGNEGDAKTDRQIRMIDTIIAYLDTQHSQDIQYMAWKDLAADTDAEELYNEIQNFYKEDQQKVKQAALWLSKNIQDADARQAFAAFVQNIEATQNTSKPQKVSEYTMYVAFSYSREGNTEMTPGMKLPGIQLTDPDDEDEFAQKLDALFKKVEFKFDAFEKKIIELGETFGFSTPDLESGLGARSMYWDQTILTSQPAQTASITAKTILKFKDAINKYVQSFSSSLTKIGLPGITEYSTWEGVLSDKLTKQQEDYFTTPEGFANIAKGKINVAKMINDNIQKQAVTEGTDNSASATPAKNERGRFTALDDDEPIRLKCEDGEFRTIQEINVLRQKMGMKPFSIKRQQGVAEVVSPMSFNDDDWYEINTETKTIVNQSGPSAYRLPAGQRQITLANGNIVVRGMRAKYMDLKPQGVSESSLAQMRDYFNQSDSDEVRVTRNYSTPTTKQNPAGIPQEIQTLVNKMYHAGKITPQEFETLRKFQQQTKINVGIKEADMNTGNQGYDSMLAVMKAVDAGHDAAFNLGGEPITLDYNEARFLAGKYKAFLKAGRQEEFLKYMESPVAFDRLMKQLRDLMDKQRNFRGSVQGERGVEESSELKQAKRKYNQAAKDANADQAGAGKKIDSMKKSLRKRDLEKQQDVTEGAEQMTPNWAKYVLDQIYNSNGDVTLTDLFDEGIPGLHDMFIDTAQKHGFDPEEDFEDVQHELTLELEDIIKGGHGLDEGVVDAVKSGAKKVFKALTGPDDEELLQRLEKETGGKRPEKKDSLPAVKESEYWCKIDRTAKLIPEGYKKLSSGYITRILG